MICFRRFVVLLDITIDRLGLLLILTRDQTASANARVASTTWEEGESDAVSVMHAFLDAANIDKHDKSLNI